jgi:hypothetical protein
MGTGRLVPSAAVAAILLIVLSEWLFLSATEPLSGWPVFELAADDAVYLVKRQLIERAPGRIVLVGDSSCTMDLVPTEIAPAAGPVVNLGTIINMSPAGFAVIAREALAQEPPPRAVVLAMLPQALEVTEQQAREWDQLGRYLIAYGEESPLYRPGVTDALYWFFRKHRVNVFPVEWGGSYPVFAAAVKKADGFRSEIKKYPGARFVRASFEPADFSLAALGELVQSAKARGVPAVLWLNPSPVDAVTPAFTAVVDRFLGQLQGEVPDLIVAQKRMPVWGGEHFGTVTHLQPEAAKVHSREFGAALKEALER